MVAALVVAASPAILMYKSIMFYFRGDRRRYLDAFRNPTPKHHNPNTSTTIPKQLLRRRSEAAIIKPPGQIQRWAASQFRFGER